MLDLLLIFLFEIVTFLLSLIPRFGETKGERKRRIAIAKQRPWLRRWARQEPPRKPIPKRGYFCEHCDYPIAGLTKPLCPECGRRIVP